MLYRGYVTCPRLYISIKYVRSYWSNLGDSWHKGSCWKFSDKYRGAKMYQEEYETQGLGSPSLMRYN